MSNETTNQPSDLLTAIKQHFRKFRPAGGKGSQKTYGDGLDDCGANLISFLDGWHACYEFMDQEERQHIGQVSLTDQEIREMVNRQVERDEPE